MAAPPEVQCARMRELGAVARLVHDLGRARDGKEIYEPALDALQEVVGVRRSAILLLERGVARFVASRGISAPYRKAAEGHFPWDIDDPAPEPIYVADVDQEQALVPLRSVLKMEQIGSLAFIPLVYRARLVGKFMLYFDRPHVFAPEQVVLATLVADLVAFALERDRLYAVLQETDRRKDTFLATLAHELRNPLAPVTTALALMGEHLDDPDCLRKNHAIVERSIHRIAKLVDELTDVSRITRGVITIDKQPTDLTTLVRAAVAPIESLISEQAQHLELQLQPLWVEADALRIEQVVTNLVHNAAKYTPRGGHVRISTAACDGGVELRVCDDGVGIAPDLLDKVFDVFVQADQSLARSRGGLGIGLALVHQLVTLHGGTIRIASPGEGRGTEVVLWLPGRIPAPPPRPAAGPDPARAVPTSRRVLVVDDNEDAAATLAMLLELWGHEVSTAGDGPAALDVVASEHPETVLLDLGLPGMDGYEVARKLRSAGNGDLHLVAVSGYGQPEDVARARAAGFDAHLTKPVEPAVLQLLIEHGRQAPSR